MKTFTKELQDKTSPEAAIDLLKEGNKRFVDKDNTQRDRSTQGRGIRCF